MRGATDTIRFHKNILRFYIQFPLFLIRSLNFVIQFYAYKFTIYRIQHSIKSITYLMGMRKLQLSFLLFYLFHVGLEAQRRNDLISKRNEGVGTIIFSIGPEYCFADTKEYPFTQSILNNRDISVGFREMFPGNFGFKAMIDWINITGDDGLLNNRSYSFSSKLWQMTLQGEYAYQFGRHFGHSAPPNTFYVFLGVGLINSYSVLNYSSRAGYTYKNNQLVTSTIIPYGFGYEYDFKNNFSVGVEYNLKYPFSDYLDGFKPPFPFSKSNDVLEGLSITIGYKIF